MTILVTGGAGFIGSNLCHFLLSNGHKVLCIDNLCSGSQRNIFDHDDYSFVQMDVAEEKEWSLIDSYDIDEIYHLACPASPPFYQQYPLKTINTCVQGSINALNYARKKNAKILLTSTSEIYGDPTEHPQKEDYRGNVNTLGIRACYDEGKRIAETLFMEYHRLFNIDTKIARIFNTYGPRMRHDDGRVITNFIKQVLSGDPITIYGDGKQTRSFCYVTDLIGGLVLLMASNLNTPVNLGNPHEYTIDATATLITSVLQVESKISYQELPQDDPTRRCPDITKASTELGWKPKVALVDGIILTVKDFIDHSNYEILST